MRIFVARQPIFDYRQRVPAYKLLFRSDGEIPFTFPEDTYSSRSVLNQTLEQFGFDDLTQGRKAHIVFPRSLLVQHVPTFLPSDRLTVEIPAAIDPDGEIVHACHTFRACGYSVVVDGCSQRSGYEQLFAIADTVKVDFRAPSTAERQEVARRFAGHRIKLLAENVDTWEDYRDALQLGYDLCQGRFFEQPEIVERGKIPVGKLNHVRLLREINRRDVDLDRLEAVLNQDVGLSVQLLRYVNSAWFGLSHRVYSLRHALVLLGTDAVRRWASLITVTGIAEGRPAELVASALFRAWFCGRLAPLAHLRGYESDLFFIGLFSLLDAMTGRPLDEQLAEIAVPDEVRATLLMTPTRLTPVYELVRAYERGDWSSVTALTKAIGVDPDRLPEIYRQSVQWVNQVLST